MVDLTSNKHETDMKNQVYTVTSTAAALPLIVVEPDIKEAEETFLTWASVHEPGWDGGEIRIERMSWIWLAQRPQLAQAVEEASRTGWSGVAYFIGHKDGWAIRAAHEDRTGVIAPYEPEVGYYLIEAAERCGHDAMVFAHHSDEAVEIYLDWHEHALGKACLQFTSRPVSRWTLTGDHATLRDDMDRGRVGVAGFVKEEGEWRVLPPDHPSASGV